jgi:hypothetical protein
VPAMSVQVLHFLLLEDSASLRTRVVVAGVSLIFYSSNEGWGEFERVPTN